MSKCGTTSSDDFTAKVIKFSLPTYLPLLFLSVFKEETKKISVRVPRPTLT